MLTRLAFQNFKSWRETGRIRLAPITAFFGSNSSGKSSLLQMLLVLKQTAESSDRAQVLNLGDDRSLVELGTFQEVLFNHDLEAQFQVEIAWGLSRPLEIEDPTRKSGALFEDDHIEFSTAVEWQANGEPGLGREVVREMKYDFSGKELGMRREAGKGTEYALFVSPENQGFKFIRTQGRPWKLPPPVKCYGFPDQVRAYYQNASFLSDFELQFERLFSRLFYLGPLREYPRRQYTWAGAQPVDVGQRGERVVDALLASRELGIKIPRGRGRRQQTVEERVAAWLKELGLIASFQVRPITKGGRLFQVWVRRDPKAAEVLITDVGFGVSQILPVITLCYYAPEGSTILLEQPEIHLHPRVQAGLADVLVDAMRTRDIQIILESHSEHLLRRLQRRVAEEMIGPEQAAIYFCSMDEGESRLTPLDLDLYGNIRNWPKDFFGDEFGEIAKMSQAALERKKRAER
jgi:predicted ATPase